MEESLRFREVDRPLGVVGCGRGKVSVGKAICRISPRVSRMADGASYNYRRIRTKGGIPLSFSLPQSQVTCQNLYGEEMEMVGWGRGVTL